MGRHHISYLFRCALSGECIPQANESEDHHDESVLGPKVKGMASSRASLGCQLHRGRLYGGGQKWTKGLGVFGKTSLSPEQHPKPPVRGPSGQQ